jgi:hypothetical protein
MDVFHARLASPELKGETWRVRSEYIRSGGKEERLVIRCPYDNSEQNESGQTITRILVGADMAPERTNWPTDEGLVPFRQFLSSLYRQGYLSSPSMLPLLPREFRQTNRYQEPDATWPPTLNPQFSRYTIRQRVTGRPANYVDRPWEHLVLIVLLASRKID